MFFAEGYMQVQFIRNSRTECINKDLEEIYCTIICGFLRKPLEFYADAMVGMKPELWC